MRSHPTIIFLLLFLLNVVPTWGAPMPRGSFLRQPVRSAAQLASQIRGDTVVASRYEKHFGIPSAQFATYAQQQLGLRPLKNSGRYTVFFIKKDGTIGSSVRRLRKGTPVFMHLRTGRAVLLAECGNPMSDSLPGYSAPVGQSTASPEAMVTAEAPLPEQPEVVQMPPPVSSLPPDPLEVAEMVQMQELDVPLWDAPFVLMLPDLPLPAAGIAAYAASVPVTPLFMVGASGLLASGGGASGRGGTTPPAVPEPASLTLWAVAGGAAASARFLRKRGTTREMR